MSLSPTWGTKGTAQLVLLPFLLPLQVSAGRDRLLTLSASPLPKSLCRLLPGDGPPVRLGGQADRKR